MKSMGKCCIEKLLNGKEKLHNTNTTLFYFSVQTRTNTHTSIKENKLMFLFSFYYTATYFLFGFFFEKNIIKHFPQRTLQCFSYFVYLPSCVF